MHARCFKRWMIRVRKDESKAEAGIGCGAVCKVANHQGHEGAPRKHLGAKAFVILRLLGGLRLVGSIMKLHHHPESASTIARVKLIVRSHLRFAGPKKQRGQRSASRS